jgi:two-component system, NarL family, sensor kinase
MQDNYKEVLLVIIVGTITLLVSSGLVFFILFFYRHKRLQHKSQLIAMEKKYAEEMLQATLEIQEHLSDEIHDNIGQILSLAKINVSSIVDFTIPPPKDKIINTKLLIGKAIQDLRHLSHTLNTEYMAANGLQRSIEHQLEIIQKSGNISTELLVEGSSYDMGQQKELLLFRIVQEALNNVLKHANASKIIIQLMYYTELFTLIIRDNGKGFDSALINDQSHFGLGIKNMQKRAHLIKAQLTIDSAHEQGSTITIVLPVS